MTTLCIIGDSGTLTRQAVHLATVLAYDSITVFGEADPALLPSGVEQKQLLEFHSSADGDAHVFYALMDTAEKSAAISKHTLGTMVNLIHPTAVISPTARLARNIYVDANSVIGVNAEVADGVVQNALSTIEHDNRIAQCAFLGTGAILCGHVSIGEFAFIGGGATVKPGTHIMANTVVGTGAVVVKDITVAGTYVGNPAQVLQNK